jgi:hypothetical protein
MTSSAASRTTVGHTPASTSFRVRADQGWLRYTLPAGAVATFIW